MTTMSSLCKTSTRGIPLLVIVRDEPRIVCLTSLLTQYCIECQTLYTGYVSRAAFDEPSIHTLYG